MACSNLLIYYLYLAMEVAHAGVRDWSDSESISSLWSGEKPNLPLTTLYRGHKAWISSLRLLTPVVKSQYKHYLFFWDYGGFISSRSMRAKISFTMLKSILVSILGVRDKKGRKDERIRTKISACASDVAFGLIPDEDMILMNADEK